MKLNAKTVVIAAVVVYVVLIATGKAKNPLKGL